MKAKKHFGQNFLVDQILIQQIIQVIRLTPQSHVIEIGPGHGALTEHLIDKTMQIDCIEIDTDLVKKLKDKFANIQHLTVHAKDILETDLTTLYDDTPLTIIGNLPYNISTPILFHMLKQKSLIKTMYFMLQKEVVDRMIAEPNNKQYGRLSVMIQAMCDVTSLVELPPEAFYPAPKVHSTFFQMTPSSAFNLTNTQLQALEKTTLQAFNQRRKTLRKIFAKSLDSAAIERLGLNPQQRPESLSVDDFIKLSSALYL